MKIRGLNKIIDNCYNKIKLIVLDIPRVKYKSIEKSNYELRTIKNSPKAGSIPRKDIQDAIVLLRNPKSKKMITIDKTKGEIIQTRKKDLYYSLDKDKLAIVNMLKQHSFAFVAKAHGVSLYILNKWCKLNEIMKK